METSVFKRTAKYLKGNITVNEKIAFEEWLSADPDHQREFEQLKKIWEYSDLRLSSEESLTEQQWVKLEKRLQEDDQKPSAKVVSFQRKRLYYVAASLALFVIAGYYFLFSYTDFGPKELGLPRIKTEDPIQVRTQLATSDEVKAFILPDGSKVWLDDNSTLSYMDDFNVSERRVKLKGRAFFDVQKDSSRVFTINARNTNITVLGTSFNVSAVPDDNKVEVTVVTGLVSFSVNRGSKEAKVSLNPDEKGVFFVDESLLDKRRNDNPDFLDWMSPKRKRTGRILPKKIIPKHIDSPKHAVVEPKKLLDHEFEWKKNLLNQTVVVGEITNHSESTTYEKFILKITCYNEKRKKEYSQEYVIDGPIAPGETIKYKETLIIDWLSNTSNVNISLEKVLTK